MKKSLVTGGCALLVLFLAWPGVCRAGGVKGKLKVSEEFQEYYNQTEDSGTEKMDYYWEVENGVLPVEPPTLDMEQEVSVALFTKDGKTPSGFLPQHPEIYGAQLVPAVIVAPPAVTLKFHNADPFVHELFSDDLGKLFTPELQSSKQTRQIQFSNPGVYKVGCKTTPHLAGWVVVAGGVVVARNPDKEGSFLFEDVAPGEYELRVYFEGKVVASSQVTVQDSDKEKDYAQVEIEMKPPAPESTKKNEGGEKKKKNEAEKTGTEEKTDADPRPEKK